jgi:hypothetical protein
MAQLSFLDSLTPEQEAYAVKIGERAKAMGIPPAFAISVAYQESRLNPATKDSEKGAVGGMQVLPKTGKGMGFDEKSLRDPDKNIDAGLKYLKQALDSTGNDPRLAAIYYNGGPGSLARFDAGEELHPETKQYLQDLKSFGTFSDAPAANPAAPAAPAQSDAEARDQEVLQAQEKAAAQLLGGYAGTSVSGAKLIGEGISKGAEMAEEGRQRATARLQPPTPTGGAAGAPPPPPASGGPSGGIFGGTPPAPPSGAPVIPQNGRMPAGQTGTMPYNYGKAAGLTDIEAGRALDMTKREGGVHDLSTKRREGTLKVKDLFPGETWNENPQHGGILTKAGGPPNFSYVQEPMPPAGALPPPGGLPQSTAVTVPQQSGLPQQSAPPAAPPTQGGTVFRQIPTAPAVPTTPPAASGLDKVRELFASMMERTSPVAKKVASGLGVLNRYAMPPLAVAGAAGEAVDIKNEINKPSEQRDPMRLGLSAGTLAGTGLGFAFPPAGIALGAGSALTQYLRDREKRQQQMTPEELYEDYYGRPYQQQPTLRFGQPDPYYKP